MVGQAASEEMYLSTVDEESGDESMLLGTSTGAEDDLDVSSGRDIWERRRSAIFKNKRMVKIKGMGKGKPCKTIIIEEDPPPAPPVAGKQLADVIARLLSPEELGLVIGHLRSSSVWGSTNCGSLWVAFLPRCFFFFEKQ